MKNDFFIQAEKTNQKFYKDSCFEERKDLIIVFNGILLNSVQLKKKYAVTSVLELIEAMYCKNKEFFKEFRGNFNGCIYDMKQRTLLLFSDHMSNKPLFYYENEKYLIVASSVKRIAKFCREYEKLELDRVGCYSLITYAYMYNDATIFNGVKRMLPGYYIWIENGKIEKYQFYKITTNKQLDISFENAVDRIDELFSNAIVMQIEKNKEYDFANYAPLSAGLDSRITTMALSRFQADRIVNFTYSESGQLDQIVPMKIAKDLGNKWIFKNLDGGLDLFQIDEAIEIADSLIYYTWSSQLNDFMKLININEMGVVHTGVIGDVIVGTYVREKGGQKKTYKIGEGAYSKKLVNKLEKNIKEVNYENYEIGMMYNRAINGACMGYSTTFSKYTEAYSPFMDIDFIDFCFSLPLEFRLQHKIYYKWVEKYYPAALKYSHNGLKISASNLGIWVKGKFIKFDTIPSRIKILLQNRLKDDNGMNPIDYWYLTNKKLANYMDSYFQKSEKLKELDNELYEDSKWLYQNGNAIEKAMALSLVGSVEKAFD